MGPTGTYAAVAEKDHPTWEHYRHHMCGSDPVNMEQMYQEMEPLHALGVWKEARGVDLNLPKIGAMKQKNIG